jgi:hypothetical protein
VGRYKPREKDFALLTQYIRNQRGSSQPILARASDGLQYIVKFTNNIQGPNLSFNESIGSELYRACGLAGPSWKALMVTDSFLDRNPDCWMQTPEGHLRPVSGQCFGSQFLGENSNRLFEILPRASFKRVSNQTSFWLAWLIDICAAHADNRQAIFEQDADGWLGAFFIDHGHLFGGPNADLKTNFLASRYLDPRIYDNVSSLQLLSFQKTVLALDIDRLWRLSESLPAAWRTASASDGFAQCLNRLANANFLRSALDMIVDSQHCAIEYKREHPQSSRKPPFSVVSFGVQDARSTQSCADHAA